MQPYALQELQTAKLLTALSHGKNTCDMPRDNPQQNVPPPLRRRPPKLVSKPNLY